MKYPVGIQNFEKIRNEGFVYVDKTALIYKLADEGNYYFLSRPRRFGKSLLISTMEAYFSGRKDLFGGLTLEKLEKDWTEQQVSGDFLNSIDSIDQSPVPIIYQSGYLTIKGYDKEFGFYTHGYPNEEVEKVGQTTCCRSILMLRAEAVR